MTALYLLQRSMTLATAFILLTLQATGTLSDREQQTMKQIFSSPAADVCWEYQGMLMVAPHEWVAWFDQALLRSGEPHDSFVVAEATPEYLDIQSRDAAHKNNKRLRVGQSYCVKTHRVLTEDRDKDGDNDS